MKHFFAPLSLLAVLPIVLSGCDSRRQIPYVDPAREEFGLTEGLGVEENEASESAAGRVGAQDLNAPPRLTLEGQNDEAETFGTAAGRTFENQNRVPPKENQLTRDNQPTRVKPAD